MTFSQNRNPRTMKTQITIVRVVAAVAAVISVSSCSLLHNENDWAMGKGSSPNYKPKQIGKTDAGPPVRGGN